MHQVLHAMEAIQRGHDFQSGFIVRCEIDSKRIVARGSADATDQNRLHFREVEEVKLPNHKNVLEAAVAMETTQQRILSLIKEGTLAAVNVGKGSMRPRWMIPNEAIEKFRPQTQVVTDRPQRPKKRHV